MPTTLTVLMSRVEDLDAEIMDMQMLASVWEDRDKAEATYGQHLAKFIEHDFTPAGVKDTEDEREIQLTRPDDSFVFMTMRTF